MGRILVVWCALSIACGSDKGTNEQLAAAPAPTELAAPTPVEAAPPVAEPPPTPQELEREAMSVQCRRGDVEACATAATLSAGLGDDAGARQYHELGCLHGSAAACGALVAVSEHWLGAACRRGDKEACRNANAPRASKFRLTAPKKGPVGERVRATYAASIEDCAVRHHGGGGAIDATFSVREGHTADIATTPELGSLADCTRAAIERWVFLEPGSDGGPHRVSARFRSEHHVVVGHFEAEAEAAIAVLLSGDSSGVEGGRQPGSDLDKQLAEIQDSHKSSGGEGGVRAPAQGTVTGPGDVKKIDAPTARIAIASPQLFDASSLTSGELVAKVTRQYAAGLKRCYQQRLKIDPDYTATVRLSFTIGENGRTRSARAEPTPPSADLAACVKGQASSWRFSIPRDEDDEPTDVDVSLDLKLTPS